MWDIFEILVKNLSSTCKHTKATTHNSENITGLELEIARIRHSNLPIPSYDYPLTIYQLNQNFSIQNYVLCVNVVRPLSSDTLLQRLRKKGVRPSGHSQALINEKLSRDPDSEIATTSLKVSLLCPLGKMRMTVPVRPITCTHMQCFDAMLFLQMNEK